ncbi:protein trichome birefringence-like 19 isoform X2 [Asparagus officinalis]|uniref:protein trichome birefringence-like 19 isoform X2 n=1 Tax=Asparagus officinalis TaxID=4686 RepID=UPI00098DFE84|nr:protein trichome birefringence-like 19 isoform X2 [Asparagus officinalis]
MQAIYSSDLLSAKRTNLEKTSKPILFLTLTLVLFTISSLYYYSLLGQSIQYEPSPPPPSSSHNIIIEQINSVNKAKECDIFRGEWIPSPNAPYYTNDTCWAIHEHQNCMKFGRPDTEFMRWRWKPKDCDLPIFNPAQFLEIVRGKSLAFVGDSVGRNQMQSLMCLLNRVTYAVDTSPTTDDKSKRWSYPTHNFTLANFWSPYLVKAQEADPRGPTLTGLFNLYLDEPDSNWTTQIENFDYVIVSTGHWFFRPTMYYENNNLKGCHYCLQKNITDLTMYYGYRMAFRTTFRAINSLQNFKGMIFLRTFAPSHFENGEWNKGGNCIRTRPFRSNETRLAGVNLELYMTQLEEFWAAEREGMKRGLKFRLLDITEAILLRPDGHPSKYGHMPGENVVMYNDCVHWCLPGPVDSWNDFLLNMLKMEGWRSASARLPQI